ncbi:MAG: hypothetical protein ACE5JR_01265 [Gemmatimonadota bacterium]
MSANAGLLLERLLETVAGSDDYFVSGSLSFLPLLGNCRQPEHDVDAAIERGVFERGKRVLSAVERIRVLRLSEVAIASELRLPRLLSPRTGFVHVTGPLGLLDVSCYRKRKNALVFTLGAGLTLEVPASVMGRCRDLSWEGVRYRAGPPELAFIPKAVSHLRARARRKGSRSPERTNDPDVRRLARIVDWNYVAELLEEGGLRWMGRHLPPAVASRIDPFGGSEILSLRQALL